eukprot:s647_g8.t1
MPAVSFQVSKSFLVWLAHVVRNILPTTSTHETRDRWDNVQECLRMSSTVAADISDKEALNRLALVIFMAWETGAEGQACRDLHLDELDTAERDLGRLVSHCVEADFGESSAGAVASAPVSKRRRLIQHDIVRVERKKKTVATQTDGTLGCKECEVEIEPEITRKNDKGVDEDSSGYDGDIDDLSDGLVDALAPELTRSRARVDALARSA